MSITDMDNSVDDDWVVGFSFKHLPVRGVLARLDQVWVEACRRREYVPPANTWLAEFMLAVTLIRYGIKADGRLSLQLRNTNDKGVRMLLAEIDEKLRIRGLARASDTLPFPQQFSELRGSILSLQLEPPDKQVSYQGMVDMRGPDLSQAMEDYFAQSEQLPTTMQLRAENGLPGGLMLQRLPGELAADEWRRLQLIAATLAQGEVQSVAPLQLLQRLFAEDDIEVFALRTPAFHCGCGRDRIARMILQLGEVEANQLIAEQNVINVTCEHCGEAYVFDAIDTSALFAGNFTVSTSHSVQ